MPMRLRSLDTVVCLFCLLPILHPRLPFLPLLVHGPSKGYGYRFWLSLISAHIPIVSMSYTFHDTEIYVLYSLPESMLAKVATQSTCTYIL